MEDCKRADTCCVVRRGPAVPGSNTLHGTVTEHLSVLLLTSDSIQHIYISHYVSVTVLSVLLNLLI